MSMTDDQIALIAGSCCAEDLPGDLAEVADFIGVDSALKLADRLGGVTVYLKKWSDDPHNWSTEIKRFADAIGITNTETIVRLFDGNYIDIPKCDALFMRHRNELIRQQAAAKTSADLAREYGLSQRHIKRIKHASKDDRQKDLF